MEIRGGEILSISPPSTLQTNGLATETEAAAFRRDARVQSPHSFMIYFYSLLRPDGLADSKPFELRIVVMALPKNWVLLMLRGNDVVQSFSLPDGPVTIGRDQTNTIVLPDVSVSRQHAEIRCGPAGVVLKDLESHNGLRVNGVPRREAQLQAGDRVEIGNCSFRLEPPGSQDTAFLPLKQALLSPEAPGQTLEETFRLPDSPHDRQLVTLYHFCFWVAEGVEEKAFIQRALRLLLESFRAQEAHLYSGGRELQSWVTEDKRKPQVKLAEFLSRQFQSRSEASVINGSVIGQHQKGISGFNFLIAPVRRSGSSTEPPFVVLVRPAAWRDFSAEDRVLLQAICQLWTRGLANANQMRELRDENNFLRSRISAPSFLGASPAMEKIRAEAQRVAPLEMPVLILGETGSGKGVLAQLLHESSRRKANRFVAVNCAAIPESLLESELFGHAKGAFSGAVSDRAGKFGEAHGGTLFLDEIGDMSLAVQAKLLRALEEKKVTRLGEDAPRECNVRVLAATHHDLKSLISAGRFRSDLFYRLNVYQLMLPPLRDHLADIDGLANHFLATFCSENGLANCTFSTAALEELKQHSWPGNIRELRSVAQRCAIRASSGLIEQTDVREALGDSGNR